MKDIDEPEENVKRINQVKKCKIFLQSTIADIQDLFCGVFSAFWEAQAFCTGLLTLHDTPETHNAKT